MHTSTASAINAHEQSEKFYQETYQAVSRIATELRSRNSTLTQADRADLLYFLKKTAEMLDDLRKEFNSSAELLANIIASVHIHQANTETSVRGGIALATPTYRTAPRIPSATKEPLRYAAILRGLGVTNEEVIEKGVLGFHWPRMVEWLSELAAQGKPNPEGIDPEDTEPVYGATSRMVKGATLETARQQAKQTVTNTQKG